MANPNPPSPPASHRFTTTNAASFGARGAAERERRILEAVPSPKQRERARRALEAVQRRQLRAAVTILHACFGPPWRPRRRPSRSPIVTLVPDAVETLVRLMREGTGMVQLRAAFAIVELGVRPFWGRWPGADPLSEVMGWTLTATSGDVT